MKKITVKEIKDALKPLCWYVTVNSNWISVGCATKELRDQVKVWVKDNLGLEPKSEWYVNRSYSVNFDRIKKD